MDIIEIIKSYLNNCINITFEYSNENGNVQLCINGEDVLSPLQSETKELVKEVNEYRQTLKKIDDCLFLEGCEIIEELCDIREVNNILDKDELSKEDLEYIIPEVKMMKSVFRKLIKDKIETLSEIYDKFKD